MKAVQFYASTPEIMVYSVPDVNLGDDAIVCGDNSMILDAGEFADATYLWSTGATTQSIEVDSTGVGIGTVSYWVEVTNQNNCKGSDTIQITYSASGSLYRS